MITAGRGARAKLFLLVLCASSSLVSCSERVARFPASGPEGQGLALFVEEGGEAAAKGRLAHSSRAVYRVEASASPGQDLEVILLCSGAGIPSATLSLEAAAGTGEAATRSARMPLGGGALRFRLSLPAPSFQDMRVILETEAGTEAAFFEVARLDIRARERYGMERVEGGLDLSAGLLDAPSNGGSSNGGPALVLPADALSGRPLLLHVDSYEPFAQASLELGGRDYELRGGHPALGPLLVPLASGGKLSLSLPGGWEGTKAFFLDRPDPEKPLPSDVGATFLWPEASFRRDDYELFSWDIKGEVLILHFIDYEAQDRMLKRLAFYTEKAGFRGRLASDEEIRGLHGWNAHDYRPESLAAFFDLAAKEDFPLNTEELALLEILRANGLVLDAGEGYAGGTGALLSASRESGGALGLKLLGHEAFHGIYFTDDDYRAACATAWAGLGEEARELILAYFSFMEYDLEDQDLMVNELGSYLLQQPLSQLSGYLRGTMAARLSSSRRFGGRRDWMALAAKGEEDFMEACSFLEDFVRSRYGLEAGRAWRLNPL